MYGKEAPPRRLRQALTAFGCVTLFAVLVGVVLMAGRDGEATPFTGVVVAKPTNVRQTQFGSEVDYLLEIRTDDGRLVRVPVSADIHRRMRIGARVDNHSGEILPTLQP